MLQASLRSRAQRSRAQRIQTRWRATSQCPAADWQQTDRDVAVSLEVLREAAPGAVAAKPEAGPRVRPHAEAAEVICVPRSAHRESSVSDSDLRARKAGQARLLTNEVPHLGRIRPPP